ncbi:hypothetical protein CsatA_005343 [Cannabis sativa]
MIFFFHFHTFFGYFYEVLLATKFIVCSNSFMLLNLIYICFHVPSVHPSSPSPFSLSGARTSRLGAPFAIHHLPLPFCFTSK